MPQYDYRCDACKHRFSVSFKTFAMYDSTILHCPQCKSGDLTRLISQVAIPKSNRDYRKLSSQEMLSVLESGETRQVEEMFKQVGGGQGPDSPATSSPESVDPEDSPGA